MKYYTGIGSRHISKDIAETMTTIAAWLEKKEYILRSGGAKGADSAFEFGVSKQENKQIFTSFDALPWAYEEAKKHLPADRKNFDSWTPYVKGLIARNMMQVLGVNGKEPSRFVLCWTPDEDYSTSKVGGTGYAIRCAMAHNIPIINLGKKDWENKMKTIFIEEFKNDKD